MAVLFQKGKLLVPDVDVSESGAFMLEAVYAPTGAGRSYFLRRLGVFLVTSRSLMLVGDWNGNFDVRVDYVDLEYSRECKSLVNLLSLFHLTERF